MEHFHLQGNFSARELFIPAYSFEPAFFPPVGYCCLKKQFASTLHLFYLISTCKRNGNLHYTLKPMPGIRYTLALLFYVIVAVAAHLHSLHWNTPFGPIVSTLLGTAVKSVAIAMLCKVIQGMKRK